MNYTINDQVTALAGMALTTKLVRDIARNGECNEDDFHLLMNTLANTNPSSVQSVYQYADEDNQEALTSQFPLKQGYQTLLNMLKEPSSTANIEHFRYLLGLMTLEKKLQKHDDLLDILGTRIDHLARQLEHFGIRHPTITASIASIYTDTLSTLPMRLQIMGAPEHLKLAQNAEKIRALLMTGIRSSALFRQTGGRRWHLLLKQKTIAKSAEQLLSKGIQLEPENTL